MAKPTLYSNSDSNSTKKQSLIEDLQASLIRRFSRAPKQPEPVVFEFTTDRAMLHQYYRLRETMYRRMFETEKFSGEEDTYDKISQILVARRGKLCIGGCRLTIREGDEMWSLPMESEKFRLRDLFPNLSLDRLAHCEISRFAILAEDESRIELMHSLSKLSIEKAIASGLGYIFVKSTYPLARNWRVIASKLGLKNTQICKDIHPPVETALDNDEKRYLGILDITSFIKPESTPVEQTEVRPFIVSAEPHLTLVD